MDANPFQQGEGKGEKKESLRASSLGFSSSRSPVWLLQVGGCRGAGKSPRIGVSAGVGLVLGMCWCRGSAPVHPLHLPGALKSGALASNQLLSSRPCPAAKPGENPVNPRSLWCPAPASAGDEPRELQLTNPPATPPSSWPR